MKKSLHFIFFFFLTFLACFSFTEATAQEPLNTSHKHKWDIGAEVSSPEGFTSPVAGYSQIYPNLLNAKDNSAFSVGLFGNYYLHNNLFIRLKASICNRKVTSHEEYNDTLLGPIALRNETIRQSSKTFALSMGKNIVEQKFIRAYVGLEIATTFFDKCYADYINDEIDSGGISFVETKTYTIPGGYAIRLEPFVGCQLFFFKNLSIGPEISYAFQYLNSGGLITYHDIAINRGIHSYFNNYDVILHFVDTNNKTGFSNIKAAFHITYSF